MQRPIRDSNLIAIATLTAAIGVLIAPSLMPIGSSTISTEPSASDVSTLATSVAWTRVHNGDEHPNLDSPAMTFDRADGYVVLFGETPFCCGFPYATQTWVYNSNEWTRLNLTVSPGPRSGASMAYDARDGYVVLFGGCSPSIGYPCELNETWKFHAGGWTNITTAASPFPRSGASMTYDAKDGCVLLFGGSWGGGPVGGTWTFRAGSWRELSTAASPSNRTDAAMSYDASDGYVVLFGGFPPGGFAPFNDTWKFVGDKWTNITSSISPSPRFFSTSTYDPKLWLVVLFSGAPGFGVPWLNDTWTFVKGSWTNVTPLYSPPPGGPVIWDGGDGYAMALAPILRHGMSTWKLT